MSEDGTSDVKETSDLYRTEAALSILPVHAAPNSGGRQLVVKRGPGRPRKVERMPTTSDLEYHALMTEEKMRFTETDPLVRAIEGNCDTMTLLHRVKLDIARETSALHFQRIENEKRGVDTAQVSSRRIDALERLAKIELKIREADRDSINLGSEKMQKIFALWVEVMREVAQEVLPPEFMDLFFSKFSSAMEDWEEKAQNVLR
jgi:hypothetical protein